MTIHDKLDYLMNNKYVTISLVYTNSQGSKETESITIPVGGNGTFPLSVASSGHNSDAFKVTWN